MGKLSIILHSFVGGGAEKVAVNLANYYTESGRDIDLVIFNSKGPYSSLVLEKVNVVNLRVNPARFWPYRLSTCRALIRYFKEIRPDYVLSVAGFLNITVGFSSFFWKPRRLVYREPNTLDDVRRRGKLSRILYEFLLKVAYRRADCLIANSPDTKADLLQHKILPESKIVVIQNPVLPLNHKKLISAEINDPWLNDPSLHVVLGVGRLSFQKNFPFLVESFERVYAKDQRTRLLILGEGEEHAALTALIKEKKLNHVAKIIEFQQNVYPYFAKSSVFALSSRWEGFGNVLVEALSVGTPVVSIDCPGGPKMILEEGKYGQLIAPDDVTGFSAALCESFDAPKARCEELIVRSQNYSVERVAELYFDAISGDSDEGAVHAG